MVVPYLKGEWIGGGDAYEYKTSFVLIPRCARTIEITVNRTCVLPARDVQVQAEPFREAFTSDPMQLFTILRTLCLAP